MFNGGSVDAYDSVNDFGHDGPSQEVLGPPDLEAVPDRVQRLNDTLRTAVEAGQLDPFLATCIWNAHPEEKEAWLEHVDAVEAAGGKKKSRRERQRKNNQRKKYEWNRELTQEEKKKIRERLIEQNGWLADKKKSRYDYREDRANDIKRHDNPHHPSQASHQRRDQASRDQLERYRRGER